jgi:uncharacterized membrane protein
VPFHFSGYSGMDVGRDNGLVVDRSYAGKAPFAFTGTVKKVVFDVAPHPDDKDGLALHENAQQAHTVRGINGKDEGAGMSDMELDVVIAAYLISDLAQRDFDELVKLVRDKQLEVEGVALVTKDADGNASVKETGDHLGRKGAEIGTGVGLVVGLFAPPLLASMIVGGAVGGLAGKFARHRVESGLEQKMGAALPPGSAGIVAIYDRSKASTVDATLVNAVKKSVAHVDGGGARELKAALAEAQASMGGGSR